MKLIILALFLQCTVILAAPTEVIVDDDSHNEIFPPGDKERPDYLTEPSVSSESPAPREVSPDPNPDTQKETTSDPEASQNTVSISEEPQSETTLNDENVEGPTEDPSTVTEDYTGVTDISVSNENTDNPESTENSENTDAANTDEDSASSTEEEGAFHKRNNVQITGKNDDTESTTVPERPQNDLPPQKKSILNNILDSIKSSFENVSHFFSNLGK